MEPEKKMADPGAAAHLDVPWIGSVVSATLNFIGAVALAAVGYVHVRLNKVESEADSATDALRETIEKSTASLKSDMVMQISTLAAARQQEERTLWDAIEAERRRSQDFREKMLGEMATKNDLSATRLDLKEHMTHVAAMMAAGNLQRKTSALS